MLFADDLTGHVPGGDADEYDLCVYLPEDVLDERLEIELDGDRLILSGHERGEASIVFALVDGDATVWETPPLPIEVVDDPDVDDVNILT